MSTTLLSPHDAAEFLNLCYGTLANWRAKNTGPKYVRMGRHIRYSIADLQKFIETKTVSPVLAKNINAEVEHA